MGKKRVTQLLEQLKAQQQQEVQNAAAIFTVAQVAVNELQGQVAPEPPSPVAALPLAPATLNKAQLLQQYGSYNGCRRAAKYQGIKFNRTPSWAQLIAAFSYVEACQAIVNSYVEAHPNAKLKGVTFELKLGQ